MPEGVWLAYYTDWSAMALFTDELEARRYAMDGGATLRVASVPFGLDLHDAVRNA